MQPPYLGGMRYVSRVHKTEGQEKELNNTELNNGDSPEQYGAGIMETLLNNTELE